MARTCQQREPAVRAGVVRDHGGLARKVEQAERQLASCCLCEHACAVDRSAGHRGRCGCGTETFLYGEGLLWGEEQFITPSYAVYFAGCNLRCSFCYAGPSNLRPEAGASVDLQAVANSIGGSPTEPASFSLIGGEPTVHLHTALRLIAALPPSLPVVWNSNFYFSETAASLLEGAADVLIADFHFGNDDCARSVAGVERYREVVTRNLRWAPTAGALVVRHLALPGHIECCANPVLRWMAAEMPDVPVHVLTNYLPPELPAADRMGEHLSDSEAAAALALVRELGLRTIA